MLVLTMKLILNNFFELGIPVLAMIMPVILMILAGSGQHNVRWYSAHPAERALKLQACEHMSSTRRNNSYSCLTARLAD